MVVGADIEKRVVLPVVPSYYLVAVYALLRLRLGRAASYLTQYPAARYYGMRFQKLYGRRGVHLRRYYAAQIVLHVHMVDYHKHAVVWHKLNRPAEALRLALLPVEAYTDGHSCDFKDRIIRYRS
jgi:hypothetical protein